MIFVLSRPPILHETDTKKLLFDYLTFTLNTSCLLSENLIWERPGQEWGARPRLPPCFSLKPWLVPFAAILSLNTHTSDVPPKPASPSQWMTSCPHLFGSQHWSHPQIHPFPPSPVDPMVLWTLWSQHSLETHCGTPPPSPHHRSFPWHHSISQPPDGSLRFGSCSPPLHLYTLSLQPTVCFPPLPHDTLLPHMQTSPPMSLLQRCLPWLLYLNSSPPALSLSPLPSFVFLVSVSLSNNDFFVYLFMIFVPLPSVKYKFWT